MQDEFLNQIIIQGINNAANPPAPNIIHFIENYTAVSKLNITEFASLSTADKAIAAINVMDAKPTTMSAVQAAINSSIPRPAPVTPPTGGSVGGGTYSPPVATPEPTVTPKPVEPTPPSYPDMGNHTWAAPAVSYLTIKGAIAGTPEGMFLPGNNIKREEFIKIVVSAFFEVKVSSNPSFEDVSESDWYYDFVATAVEKNITKGMGDGKFGVGLNITRQDMAVMLYNVAVSIGATVNTTPVTFSDDDQIADYAKDAVYALKNMDVVKGMGDNQFAPTNTATRAEAAQMVYGIMNVLGK